MSEVKQRHKLANYLMVETAYKLCGAGFTDLDESPSAQTSAKKYVNDKSETKRIKGYDWSTSFTTDQIRDEDAVDSICTIGEEQKTGKDAETKYCIVDLERPVSGAENTYYAREFDVAIEISDFSNDDGEMQASGNLLGIGDVRVGQFNTTTCKFEVETE